jgi:hypothetical protein
MIAREQEADDRALPGHAPASGVRLTADKLSAGSDGEN